MVLCTLIHEDWIEKLVSRGWVSDKFAFLVLEGWVLESGSRLLQVLRLWIGRREYCWLVGFCWYLLCMQQLVLHLYGLVSQLPPFQHYHIKFEPVNSFSEIILLLLFRTSIIICSASLVDFWQDMGSFWGCSIVNLLVLVTRHKQRI